MISRNRSLAINGNRFWIGGEPVSSFYCRYQFGNVRINDQISYKITNFIILAAWLKSPEGRAWGEQQIKEAVAIAEEFAAEVKAGKFDLTPAELEQLNRDGTLGKCHPIKRTP